DSPEDEADADQAILKDEILNVLASLVAKSIVIADRRPGDELRYRLPEYTRQYAREKLLDTPFGERLYCRHRDYYLGFAEMIVPKLDSSERLIWERKLESELGNLRLALDWSFNDEVNIEAAPKLVLTMSYLWPSHQEGISWLNKGIAWCRDHAQISPLIYSNHLQDASRLAAANDPQTA